MTGALFFAAMVLAQAQMPAKSLEAEGTPCETLQKQIDDKVRWCGSDKVPLAEIARRFAPILWFSPNEPLLAANPRAIEAAWKDAASPGKRSCSLENIPGTGTISIPHRLPGDDGRADGKDPAVYYQLVEFDRGPQPFAGNAADELVDLTAVRQLHLRFFFYYLCDIGTNAHADDLEATQFTLDVVDEGKDCRRLEVNKITGFAHGLEWVYNTLEVEGRARRKDPNKARLLKASDLLLPATVLVEEGKHASSPDRNGDGAFTPGYDVNKNVAEAWGVRDNFGSGLVVTRYHAEDTKDRVAKHRIFPAGISQDDPLHDYYTQCSSPKESWDAGEPTYDLLSARLSKAKEKAHGLGDGDFGDDPNRHSWAREKFSMMVHRASITARWDQPEKFAVGDRHRGVRARWPNQLTLTLPGFHPGPIPVWLAARGTFNIDRTLDRPNRFQQVDVLLMPSAARWFDPYVSLWGYTNGENAQMLPEIGYRIRLVSKEPPFRFPRPLARVVPLLGLRVGLRLPPLQRILGIDKPSQDGARAVRLVVEFGGGAF